MTCNIEPDGDPRHLLDWRRETDRVCSVGTLHANAVGATRGFSLFSSAAPRDWGQAVSGATS